ncbi:MAG: enolase C-terminal domain-like protein [Balneolales bacterium]
MQIENVYCEFEREPLSSPFGFKGGYMKEIWQTTALLETSDGTSGTGLGCQSVLWSDGRVFTAASESGGNSIMFAITEKGLQLARGRTFETPLDLLNQIFPEAYEYGCKITGIADLNKTFVLNALMPLDNAAWMVYARSNGLTSFDEMIPAEFRPALSWRHDQVASIPAVPYGMHISKVRELVGQDGYFMLKIKLGSPGSQEEMLEKDKKRIEQIHNEVGDLKVEHAADGKIPYYIDANGRYESKEAMMDLLDHIQKIGAIDQVYLLEEPFPEHYKVDVGDLGVTVVADESAHTAKNVAERIGMGYGAIALKPIVKTLSFTLEMAKIAHEHKVPCFCADLTVNPVLVDWNKNIAARLQPVPGLDVGLMETNGHQNYRNWPAMQSYHPYPEATWLNPEKGIFKLDETFYENNGGILETPAHYLSLIKTGTES